MAKKRTNDDEIPSLGDTPATQEARTATATSEPLPSVMLELPMGTIPPLVYSQKHLDLQLSSTQGLALKRLYYGLDREGARMANNQRVQSSADAIRWLLDQFETDA